jgi:hypothetical protein
MKIPPKGGSRLESLPRVDPTDGAGGQASNPGDGGTRRGTRVPVGVVAVEESPPSRRQTFSRCAASPPARRRPSSVASRLKKRGDGHRSRADGRPSHRREVGVHQATAAATEAAHGTAETRPSPGAPWNAMDLWNRCLLAGPSRRRVRTVENGIWQLPPMARTRSLAADSEGASARRRCY